MNPYTEKMHRKFMTDLKDDDIKSVCFVVVVIILVYVGMWIF